MSRKEKPKHLQQVGQALVRLALLLHHRVAFTIVSRHLRQDLFHLLDGFGNPGLEVLPREVGLHAEVALVVQPHYHVREL